MTWTLNAVLVLLVGALIGEFWVRGWLGFKTAMAIGCTFSTFMGLGWLLAWGS